MQLKVFVRIYWRSEREREKAQNWAIPEEDRELLLQQLLPAFYQLSRHSCKCGNLLLDTAQLMGQSLCRWLLQSQTLVDWLQSEDHLKSCLMVLLGVAKSYQCINQPVTFKPFGILLQQTLTLVRGSLH